MRLRDWVRGSLRDNPAIGINDYLNMVYQGLQYPLIGSLGVNRQEEIGRHFESLAMLAYRANPIVFTCVQVRMMLFAEARFQFRRMINGRPAGLFGTRHTIDSQGYGARTGYTRILAEQLQSERALEIIERPEGAAASGTTRSMMARALQDVDLDGNWFGRRVNLPEPRIQRMRPDWTIIALGSKKAQTDPQLAIDAEVIGYGYQPKGFASGEATEVILPEFVAHWAPTPDPLLRFRGMSWLEVVLSDVMADKATTQHKLTFFEHGATPNMIISYDPSVSVEAVEKFIEKFQEEHEGVLNAYKTLHIGGGATATIVGANMRQLDFKSIQGAGETRIAAASGLSPVIAGFSEGLQGSSMNVGNFSAARRRLADMTMRPLWGSYAGALAPIIEVPGTSELWYDDRDIPALQEDQKDKADIQNKEADTITRLVREGYEPDSVIAAVDNNEWSLLKHTGLISVQLHKPGETPQSPPQQPQLPAPTNEAPTPAKPAAKPPPAAG